MNDEIFRIISETLKTEEDIILTEEELLSEGIFFKVSPFTAFSAFKQKAFNSLLNSKAFIIAKKGVEKVNPIGAVADIKIGIEKIKSKLGGKGSNKNDTVYRLRPEQRKVLAEIYNKYGKGLVSEIEDFRSKILAPYQLIKKTIKKNRTLTSKEVSGLSKEEFLSARESGRKKIEKREKMGETTAEGERQLDIAKESLERATELYDNFGKSGDYSNETMEKMLKVYGAGIDALQGYSLEELKSTYEAIVRNKALIEKKMKYDDADHKTDILKLLKDNRILRDKGTAAFVPKLGKEEIIKRLNTREKKGAEEETQTEKKGSFTVAFNNYMLRNNIKTSFKSEMGGEIYKATYKDILKDNIKIIKDRREAALIYFVKQKNNLEFTKKEGMVWGKIPTNLQKYSGNIKDYYQKIRDEDYKAIVYYEKSQKLIQAENAIENEIKRFERKLVKIVEPEDLAKLKKYRLINNLIIVSELKDPSSLFKTREEIMDMANKSKKEYEYIDEEEYVRKIKHLVGIKYDTFQELFDAKEEVKTITANVDKDIADNYKDIVNQFMLKRTLAAEKITGHKYDSAGDVIDINDVENLVNDILKKDYKNVDLMKQDKMQLDSMIEKYKNEEPNAEKELNEIKLLLSQIDRKLQGMSIIVIGKGKGVAGLDKEDEEDDTPEADGKNEALEDKEKK